MIGTRSPWGEIKDATHIDGTPQGVVFVSTASHGGFYVPPVLLNSMYEPFVMGDGGRFLEDRRQGWFEEDCDALLVLGQWPAAATPGQRRGLTDSLSLMHGDEAADLARVGVSLC